MDYVLFVDAVLLAACLVALVIWRRGTEVGQTRFFLNQTYHFQTLRVFNDIPAGGADTGEILQAIKSIRSGDAQSWYRGWEAAAERTMALAAGARDAQSRGGALLRAHNYFRTAQFLLPPNDPKRPTAFAKDTAAFYEGLDALAVRHEVFAAPYLDASLKAIYYPGAEGANAKPLIVFFGGYDSTLEELYFVLAAAAQQRGYSVLTFEGPGQGGALREQGLTFTHEWEKPTSAVLNEFLAQHDRPTKMIMVGMSMGGYLAPRVAAFDERADGVVAFDVFFDLSQTARRYMPSIAFWLHDHGFAALVSFLVKVKCALNPDAAWALHNGRWVMGTHDAIETVRAFDPYTLKDCAPRIRGDVLILAGKNDHFVPISQVQAFERSLTNARSVTTCVYDETSGGAEHCQLGAATLWHRDFFDWIEVKFGGTALLRS
ncbi:MAG: alpha/beta hydrolase family protein [Beijerinckiaceae bacterium]